jgi:4-amino-4-deoxy-L-arabinose transferase-like glycosyltransferase
MRGRERLVLWALLAATLLVRALFPGQPIVENYIGRQIPTAMVARNLDRGSGFLRPQTDVGPFPSLFLVEPPVYPAVVVAVSRATGLPREPVGRLVSAVGIAVAAWGLFGLVRARLSGLAALASVGAFAAFPLLIRHGRVFQPDALMLGALLAGLRCWDEYEAGAPRHRLVAAWLLLAGALALKFTSAYVLVPLMVAIVRPRRSWKLALALSTLLPAAAWYLHAQRLLHVGQAAGGTEGAVELWLHNLRTFYAAGWPTYRLALEFLLSGSFTPLGFLVAVWGWFRLPDPDRLWRSWLIAALASLVLLAKKLEHEYYLFALASLVAVGIGQGLADVSRRRPWGPAAATAAGAAFLALAAWSAAPTFRTPGAWSGLDEAGRLVQAHVGPEEWVVAAEPLLYAADRRGCRLAFYDGVTRAAREWNAELPPGDVLGLVELYHGLGARYFADVPRWSADPARRELHRTLRRRYVPVVNHPELLLIDLAAPKDASGPPR